MAKKRAAGEGTINQLPSGSWRAQVYLKGKRISFTARSQQAARDWIRKIQAQIEQGMTYDDERITLGAFLEGWLASKKNQVRLATYEQYEWTGKTYILPNLGSVKLKDLSPGRVQTLYDELLRSGKGARTIQVLHRVLYSCLAHAKNLGLIIRNPAEFCKVPRQHKSEMKTWTEDQVSQFLAHVRGQKNENLYYIALSTGMRRGELLGLKWQDVDWIKQTLTIRRQCFHPKGGGFIFQEPKTNRGIRTLQLGPGAIECLKKQFNNIDTMRRISKDRWKELDLIFPSLLGTPLSADNVTHEFQELIKAAALPSIRFHDCRHTAASIMLNYGIPPVIVAGVLGHSLAVLMDEYAHFIPSMQDEAVKLMDQVTSPLRWNLHKD